MSADDRHRHPGGELLQVARADARTGEQHPIDAEIDEAFDRLALEGPAEVARINENAVAGLRGGGMDPIGHFGKERVM